MRLINSKFIISLFLGLVFIATTGHATTPEEISFEVNDFVIEGDSPLLKEEIDQQLQSEGHKRHTLLSLQKVGKELEQFIRSKGHAFYRVVLPPQTLNNGIISLKVVDFKVSDIEVSGNQYFDKDNIIASLPGLKQGESPNTRNIAEYIKVANRHPAKQVKLTFKQSDAVDSIKANIVVSDQRPYQASLIINNTGSETSGEFRMTAAVQHANLWNMDHILNGSYTSSPDNLSNVQQYGVNYSIPLYKLKSWLSAYYAYSNVDTGVVANDFDVTGSGEMFGIHYLQYLPRIARYEHWLDLGIDNRYFINDIRFLGTQIGTNVRSVPFSAMYKGGYEWPLTKLGFYLQWLKNTDLGGHNTQQHYIATRLNSKQDWDLYRYGVNITGNLKRWIFSVKLTGQYANSSLISGEQIGLGGSYSVRGYNERETSADAGEVVNLEIYTPRWKGLNFLTFYDYGHGRKQDVQPGELKKWTVSSIGVGARWQWKTHVQTRVDLAHTLEQAGSTNAGTNRIHASIILRY